MVSIIIRAKNEEKWVTSCLRAIFNQTHKDFEIIIVDNKSTDKTVEKAKAFGAEVIQAEEFLPGKVLNTGIRHGKGDIIVSLSGHCIPVNDQWLANLIENFKDNNVAGVYGRQEPMSFTRDADKRDLLTIFGLDKKVQKKDPFFHNANSAIRRKVWEEIPFDEEATNIEDRIWGKQVLAKGYTIVYEPKASVYHYHGIHQDGNPQFCENVVRVLETLSLDDEKNKKTILDINALDILALIPIKGEVEYCGKRPLLEYTLQRARQSRFIDRVIVSTDNQRLADIAHQAGAGAPFLRPKELSMDHVDIGTVLQYSLNQLEEMNILPDIVVILGTTYPFRPVGFIDELIIEIVKEGLDSVIPVRPEYRTPWLKKDSSATVLGQRFMPRQFKDPSLYISLLGLGCATHPSFIREGRILGDKVGFLEVKDSYSYLEVRDEESIEFADKFIDEWWRKNKGKEI